MQVLVYRSGLLRKKAGGSRLATRDGMGGQFGTLFKKKVAAFDAFVADIGAGSTARWIRNETCHLRLAFVAEGAPQRIVIFKALVLGHRRDPLGLGAEFAAAYLPTTPRHFSNNWSSVSTCSSGVFGDFPPKPAPVDVFPIPVVVVMNRISSSAISSFDAPVRGGVSFSSVI